MKYRDFKAELDRYFDDDEEIYPHAWGGCVSFYKIYHGQNGGLIEIAPGGDRVSITFKVESDLKGLAAREAQP